MLVNDTAQKSSCFESLDPKDQYELEIYVTGLIQGALAYRDNFTVPDIVGGRFRNWGMTPLEYIYEYHWQRIYKKLIKSINKNTTVEKLKDFLNSAEKEAEIEAGKDVGRIVKYIMSIDKARYYKVIGTEQRRYPVNVYALVDIKLESENKNPILWGLNFD